ncbi:TIGR02206 family membrane protein [Solirubrobacter phytolaccae]|uniref:TIGR02206 family membrane protein n=1 Tax=Solirubrobacter phytolaccae TaxID=1404360 RepID=A0A9X3NEY4_9ACTN|nr:TIGR02206 family membrane protein [Solirubrobacter phytolaccae]MDA0183720.1 TIGR02206 family membrane protein [Solirubrobacter phytolaccae]
MRQFSVEHLVVLALTVAAIVVAIKAPKAIPPKVLAVAIGGAFAIEFAVRATDGSWNWGFDLPLHLSDVVSLLAPVALWTRKPLLVEVLYFWALTASLQAVITPDLYQTVPSVFFFTYFLTHSGAVIAACLLVFGLKLKPRPGAVKRVFGVTLGMAAAAGLGDVLTGGNYMYLRAKPSQASLLDQMGPWPLYIVIAAVIAVILFAALDRLARSPRC